MKEMMFFLGFFYCYRFIVSLYCAFLTTPLFFISLFQLFFPLTMSVEVENDREGDGYSGQTITTLEVDDDDDDDGDGDGDLDSDRRLLVKCKSSRCLFLIPSMDILWRIFLLGLEIRSLNFNSSL